MANRLGANAAMNVECPGAVGTAPGHGNKRMVRDARPTSATPPGGLARHSGVLAVGPGQSGWRPHAKEPLQERVEEESGGVIAGERLLFPRPAVINGSSVRERPTGGVDDRLVCPCSAVRGVGPALGPLWHDTEPVLEVRVDPR